MVMEWMGTITGDHVGLGKFSPKKEKNLGEQKFASFGVEFSRSGTFIFLFLVKQCKP